MYILLNKRSGDYIPLKGYDFKKILIEMISVIGSRGIARYVEDGVYIGDEFVEHLLRSQSVSYLITKDDTFEILNLREDLKEKLPNSYRQPIDQAAYLAKLIFLEDPEYFERVEEFGFRVDHLNPNFASSSFGLKGDLANLVEKYKKAKRGDLEDIERDIANLLRKSPGLYPDVKEFINDFFKESHFSKRVKLLYLKNSPEGELSEVAKYLLSGIESLIDVGTITDLQDGFQNNEVKNEFYRAYFSKQDLKNEEFVKECLRKETIPRDENQLVIFKQGCRRVLLNYFLTGRTLHSDLMLPLLDLLGSEEKMLFQIKESIQGSTFSEEVFIKLKKYPHIMREYVKYSYDSYYSTSDGLINYPEVAGDKRLFTYLLRINSFYNDVLGNRDELEKKYSHIKDSLHEFSVSSYCNFERALPLINPDRLTRHEGEAIEKIIQKKIKDEKSIPAIYINRKNLSLDNSHLEECRKYLLKSADGRRVLLKYSEGLPDKTRKSLISKTIGTTDIVNILEYLKDDELKRLYERIPNLSWMKGNGRSRRIRKKVLDFLEAKGFSISDAICRFLMKYIDKGGFRDVDTSGILANEFIQKLSVDYQVKFVKTASTYRADEYIIKVSKEALLVLMLDPNVPERNFRSLTKDKFFIKLCKKPEVIEAGRFLDISLTIGGASVEMFESLSISDQYKILKSHKDDKNFNYFKKLFINNHDESDLLEFHDLFDKAELKSVLRDVKIYSLDSIPDDLPLTESFAKKLIENIRYCNSDVIKSLSQNDSFLKVARGHLRENPREYIDMDIGFFLSLKPSDSEIFKYIKKTSMVRNDDIFPYFGNLIPDSVVLEVIKNGRGEGISINHFRSFIEEAIERNLGLMSLKGEDVGLVLSEDLDLLPHLKDHPAFNISMVTKDISYLSIANLHKLHKDNLLDRDSFTEHLKGLRSSPENLEELEIFNEFLPNEFLSFCFDYLRLDQYDGEDIYNICRVDIAKVKGKKVTFLKGISKDLRVPFKKIIALNEESFEIDAKYDTEERKLITDDKKLKNFLEFTNAEISPRLSTLLNNSVNSLEKVIPVKVKVEESEVTIDIPHNLATNVIESILSGIDDIIRETASKNDFSFNEEDLFVKNVEFLCDVHFAGPSMNSLKTAVSKGIVDNGGKKDDYKTSTYRRKSFQTSSWDVREAAYNWRSRTQTARRAISPDICNMTRLSELDCVLDRIREHNLKVDHFTFRLKVKKARDNSQISKAIYKTIEVMEPLAKGLLKSDGSVRLFISHERSDYVSTKLSFENDGKDYVINFDALKDFIRHFKSSVNSLKTEGSLSESQKGEILSSLKNLTKTHAISDIEEAVELQTKVRKLVS